MKVEQGGSWLTAISWGLRVAFIQRLVLLIWMALIWFVIVQPLNIPVDLHVDPVAHLPVLNRPLEQATYGVWRRWDVSHYLNLAQNGYRVNDPGPTVFGALVPASINLLAQVFHSEIDFAGMVFATLAFSLMLTLLYRVCEKYYADGRLARWSVIVTAISPLAFFFQAPMSEAIYLAMVLGFFYALVDERWGLAGICGVLAVLARAQGLLLAGVGTFLLWSQSLSHGTNWVDRVIYVIQRWWWLGLMPLGFALFLNFREFRGLPPVEEVYRTYSYVFFTNPVRGLYLNILWGISHPASALLNIDLWALIATLVLCILLVRDPNHRKLPFIVYTLGFILVFVCKVNWKRGNYQEITYTQSFARYSMSLFPLTIYVADKLRHFPPRLRTLTMGGLICVLLVFSALFTLGGGEP